MSHFSSDIAFTPAVKDVQSRRGSRKIYEKVEARGGFQTLVTEDLAAFLAEVDTAYLATANADGQPYAQHRGGPKGFIRVIDEHTIGFADFAGNRQYISTGNLAENSKAFLFLMDYENRRRIKIWGRARIVEGDATLLARLMPNGYSARAEQVILFEVDAWDINCPQHIPQKFNAADVAAAIRRLEAENSRLKQQIATQSSPASQVHCS
jgi:predicted pyridoxine 5'-phosphate oxidase superfamily flavin-nucleotide-binding protein